MNLLEENFSTLHLDEIRDHFPTLNQQINGHPLVYLDNAATTQKPLSVIEALNQYYHRDNANVHRGIHDLSDRATEYFESARTNIQSFINAEKIEEIIWTRGTTEGINLVAQSYARPLLRSGDEVLVSAMEHHSNIVPWQMVCEQTGATLNVVPVNDRGEIIIDTYLSMLSDNVKIIAITHVSNALGTINPIKQIIQAARQTNATILIDGAQAVAHFDIDVIDLDCDFYVFSGHKLFGPTGIGILYGKETLLKSMQPYQVGGEMIETVSFGQTTFNELPYKFEAGTPNIAGAIGLSAAIDYLKQFDRSELHHHENHLLEMATDKALSLPYIKLIGTAANKTGVLSFMVNDVHPHDVGLMLNQQGIAVRTGHHCAMPIMEQYEIPGTVRASFAFYNNEEDVERFFSALDKTKCFFL